MDIDLLRFLIPRWKDGELVSSVKHHGDGKQFVVQVSTTSHVQQMFVPRYEKYASKYQIHENYS